MMILKTKIITFFLLYTFINVSGLTFDTSQSTADQQKDSIVLTVFNSENFYVTENALTINKKHINVVDNKIIASKNVVFYQNPQNKIKTDNTVLIAAKKIKVKSKFLSTTTTVTQKPNDTTNYLPFGSFPNDNSLFACNLHNNVIAPSKSRFILNADCILQSFNKKLKYIALIKKVFLSSEKLFIASFYSKSSKIRPPPAV